ncbi:MAG: flagellin hook IN motif-containing protein [Pirellulales bacterium]
MIIGPQRSGFPGVVLTRPLQFDAQSKSVRVSGPRTNALSGAIIAGADSKSGDMPATVRGDADRSERLDALLNELREFAQRPATKTVGRAVPMVRSEITRADATREFKEIVPVASYSTRTVVLGANAAQVTDVGPLGNVARSMTLQGTATRNAAGASLAIVGDGNGAIARSGLYDLTSDRGTFALQITAGEELTNVADRINEGSDVTGVDAVVEDGKLVLTTTTVGSAGTLRLNRLDQAPTVVTGRDAQQVSGLDILVHDTAATETIAGTVLTRASVARLTYQGAADGTTAGGGTIRLTGTQGDAIITLTKGESLDAFAHRVNTLTEQTGVAAVRDGTTIRFESVGKGEAATVKIDQLTPTARITHDIPNPTQIASFTVDTLNRGATDVVSGTVTAAATKAVLTLNGKSGARVAGAASYRLRGDLGTVDVTIAKNEALAAVATRVNAAAAQTGVSARVSGNQLLFESAARGSTADVSVENIQVAYVTSVTGVDSAQVAAFNVTSLTNGASETLSGQVTRAAGIAEATYAGNFLSTVKSNAQFTLTGVVGSRTFSVTALQSLSSVATAVNAKTAETGVTATVEGTTIKFRSVDVGSVAKVQFNVTSGTFAVTGLDGTGTAHGIDATAVVNGANLTANANQFTFAGSQGVYRFDVNQGYLGTLSPIAVTSTADAFVISGNNGSAAAKGTNATATINGVGYEANVDTFHVTTAQGSYSLTVNAGYTGTLGPITSRSTLDEIAVMGGDAAGTAFGTDFTANVNGQLLRSTTDDATLTTAHGGYRLTFAGGFVGAFAPITVGPLAGSVVEGGDAQGRATGLDAEATINGRRLTGVGNDFVYNEDGTAVRFKLTPGYLGAIDPITIANHTDTHIDNVVRTTRKHVIGSQEIPTISEPTANPDVATDDDDDDDESRIAEILREIESLSVPKSSVSSSTTAPSPATGSTADSAATPIAVQFDDRTVTRAQIVARLAKTFHDHPVANQGNATRKFGGLDLSI